MNNELNHLINSFYRDWKDKEECLICLDVLEYLINTHPKHLAYLSYSSLYKISKLNAEDPKSKPLLINIITYLSGDNIKLLQPCFELVDNNKTHSLTNKEVKLILKSGVLYHAITNEIITDLDKIVIYFTVTDVIKTINVYF